MERACFSLPKFNELYLKLKRYIEISGKSKSTLSNYTRCLATMALHFNCSPEELDEDQVLDYLQYLKTQSNTPSSSYFKHTVYGLR
ncbi:MAG: phage integrase N-terminal SAM-like domain-containing protein, partial [Bacteroidota bacterium]|nr:phage integrase N-terminal SAM-like domain-containing protein [Bacteroidota bacterium]